LLYYTLQCHFCLDDTLWDSLPVPTSTPLPLPSTTSAQEKSTTNVHSTEKPVIEASAETEKENEEYDCEDWRNVSCDTIFQPILKELQPNWDSVGYETRVLDGPGAIAAETKPGPVAIGSVATESRRRSSKPVPKKEERQDISDTTLLEKVVPVPLIALKKLWNDSMEYRQIPSALSIKEARIQMHKVHKQMVNLRCCFTFAAAEKSCLDLSVALLDLAAMPACQDPLLCLQQAAIYASQASKAGNSDFVFRRAIPSVNDCTPLQALIILGRADCLHSVYFPREAAFLCSFVARTCSLHRDSLNSNHEWNDRWKVVGIYAHNVSIMIRMTANCMIKHSNYNKQVDFSSMWEKSVMKELEKGRIDAKEILEKATLDPTDNRKDECQEGGESHDHGLTEQQDNDYHSVDGRNSDCSAEQDVPESSLENSYDYEQIKNQVYRILSSPTGKASIVEDDEEIYKVEV
jgi:hypothetical protein